MQRLEELGFSDEEIIRIRLICRLFKAQKVTVEDIKK